MSRIYRNYALAFAGIILGLLVLIGISTTAREPFAAKAAPLVSWTCDATIKLTGSGAIWTPPTWTMSGPFIIADREKRCLNTLKANWIDNGAIWNYIKSQLTSAQQNAICKSGSGTFRLDYGFDKRPKDWSTTATIPAPPCNCAKSCPGGYGITGNGNCAKSLCSAPGLSNQGFFQNGQGLFTWDGAVYHQLTPTAGSCTFQ